MQLESDFYHLMEIMASLFNYGSNNESCITDSQRNKAIKIALDIAVKAIKYLDVLHEEQNEAKLSEQGIITTYANLAIFYDHLDICFPKKGWDIIAKNCLSETVKSLNYKKQYGMGLFEGFTGIAFAAFYLSRFGTRYKKIIHQIDAIYLPEIEKKAENLISLSNDNDGYYSSDFDVISGLSGITGYLLLRKDNPKVLSCLQQVVAALCKISRIKKGIPLFRTPGNKAVGTLAQSFPQGFIDCGLSHGIAGPISALSMVSQEGLGNPEIRQIVYEATEWLIRQQVDDKWGVNWPAAIPLNSVSYALENSFFLLPNKPTKTAWCYGIPGIANTLWLAGSVFEEKSWIDSSVVAMKSALERPKVKRYINSYGTFCHGIAGLLFITYLFYLRTNDSYFQSAIQPLIDQQLELFAQDSQSGYMRIDFDGKQHIDFTILDGAAGAALTLLSIAKPVHLMWARVFLLV